MEEKTESEDLKHGIEITFIASPLFLSIQLLQLLFLVIICIKSFT